MANTCVESTIRFAAELGYDVTMAKHAAASFPDEEMHAAIDINIPNYTSATVATNEVVAAISSLYAALSVCTARRRAASEN